MEYYNSIYGIIAIDVQDNFIQMQFVQKEHGIIEAEEAMQEYIEQLPINLFSSKYGKNIVSDIEEVDNNLFTATIY